MLNYYVTGMRCDKMMTGENMSNDEWWWSYRTQIMMIALYTNYDDRHDDDDGIVCKWWWWSSSSDTDDDDLHHDDDRIVHKWWWSLSLLSHCTQMMMIVITMMTASYMIDDRHHHIDRIVHWGWCSHRMHWLYTMRYFSVTNGPTNKQGDSRSWMYICFFFIWIQPQIDYLVKETKPYYHYKSLSLKRWTFKEWFPCDKVGRRK